MFSVEATQLYPCLAEAAISNISMNDHGCALIRPLTKEGLGSWAAICPP